MGITIGMMVRGNSQNDLSFQIGELFSVIQIRRILKMNRTQRV
jgi:hypothetical protein